MELYQYIATVNRVIDGDTLDLTLDLGFKISWRTNCRLAGINTPELTSTDLKIKEAAYGAKKYVEDRLKPGDKIVIKSMRLDKYGRAIAVVFYGKGFSNEMNRELLEGGWAVKYMAD